MTPATTPTDTASGPPTERGPKGRGSQLVFEVIRTERLGPHLVRVYLGGAAFDSFLANADPARLSTTDKYVKLLLARPELDLTPPYDLDQLRETLAPDELPVRRTYTVRDVDEENRCLAIDFVVLGDEGVAGPWAVSARPGDLLAFSGPGGQFTPSLDPALPRLLIGDDSAIPAIAAALAAMPAGTPGLALVEVDGPADELPMPTPADVEIRWLHRTVDGETTAYGQRLSEVVSGLDRPEGQVEIFAHGERGAMKLVSQLVHGQWGLDRRSTSVSAYWAVGRAEDRFQAEKRDPVGQV